MYDSDIRLGLSPNRALAYYWTVPLNCIITESNEKAIKNSNKKVKPKRVDMEEFGRQYSASHVFILDVSSSFLSSHLGRHS